MLLFSELFSKFSKKENLRSIEFFEYLRQFLKGFLKPAMNFAGCLFYGELTLFLNLL